MVDQIAGEPPTAAHPVAWFGSVMQRVERVTYRDHRAAGVVHLAVGVSVAAATGIALERLVGRTTATAIAASVAIAGRMLTSEAAAVIDAVERDDLLAARARVTALVGRDTTGLPASELVRATIESVAENTVDAVTAPIFWAAVAGPTGVLVHRAVNTLDAMVGHRNARYERFGWASARLDDVLNWIPARLGALTVIALRPRRCKEIRRAVRVDARAHPSPNGGVIEAAFAAGLGVRLGGTNTYAGRSEDRGTLGRGRTPTTADARRALTLARNVGASTAAAAVVGSIARSMNRNMKAS